MKILIDTNVLISAILSPSGQANKAFIKAVTYPNKGFICSQNIEELHLVFKRKFPSKIQNLNHFLTTALSVIDLIPIPNNTHNDELLIRDMADRPILRAAIHSNIDILLTGDKDFLESSLIHPIIMSPTDFLSLL